ncbi:META domain-containing protein [Sphingomonas sp.]|uniref:META domain-containing protein n=1 Tax=Sphingomonas sp. TaxID=28214 RepID=UPI001ECB59CD|nr:META domain-containing protein [Sphingomonas sp.]MBX3593839.1 META domain-containing protein [Sphingomonas sp.]
MRPGTLILAAALPLALAGPALARPDAPYRAVGTEPFWSLTIDDRAIIFEPMEGRALRVARPRPIVGFNGEIYRTPRLSVDVTHVRCNDGMSDRTYRDTVKVTLGRRVLSGCGGPAIAGAARAAVDGDWHIQRIANAPVANRDRVTIRFAEGRVSGDAGCNRFSGSFRLDRGIVSIGPLATTRRACTNRYVQQQENDLLRLLQEKLSASTNRAGKLILTARNGRSLVLAPAR